MELNSFIDILKGDDEYLFVLDMIEDLVDAEVKTSDASTTSNSCRQHHILA